VTIFIDGPISSKTLTKMGVEADLVSLAATSSEGDRTENARSLFGHERKVRTRSTRDHRGFRTVICARLANNKAIAFGRKICSKDDKSVVVEAHEAWVGENCFLYVVQRALGGVRP
jgi:hypothetical protein